MDLQKELDRAHDRINGVQERVGELTTAQAVQGNRLDRAEKWIEESAAVQAETQRLVNEQTIRYGHLLEKIETVTVEANDAAILATSVNSRLIPIEADRKDRHTDWRGVWTAVAAALAASAIIWMLSRMAT